jgi:hypothetical protein
MEHPLSLAITCVLWMPLSKPEQAWACAQISFLLLSQTNFALCESKGTILNSKKVVLVFCHFLTLGANGALVLVLEPYYFLLQLLVNP